METIECPDCVLYEAMKEGIEIRIADLDANRARLLANLENLVTAIEAGITTETMLECGKRENSYLADARKAIANAK